LSEQVPEDPKEKCRLERKKERAHWRAFNTAFFGGLDSWQLDRAMGPLTDRRLTKEERWRLRELMIAKAKAQEKLEGLNIELRRTWGDQESRERWQEQKQILEQLGEELQRETQRLHELADHREYESQERSELSPEEERLPLAYETLTSGKLTNQFVTDPKISTQWKQDTQEQEKREQQPSPTSKRRKRFRL
jgi:hypothetical protein